MPGRATHLDSDGERTAMGGVIDLSKTQICERSVLKGERSPYCK
jgi:hypothetical protein